LDVAGSIDVAGLINAGGVIHAGAALEAEGSLDITGVATFRDQINQTGSPFNVTPAGVVSSHRFEAHYSHEPTVNAGATQGFAHGIGSVPALCEVLVLASSGTWRNVNSFSTAIYVVTVTSSQVIINNTSGSNESFRIRAWR
jgi:hypothetical protein